MKKILITTFCSYFLILSGSSQQKFTGGLFVSPLVSWMKPDSKKAELAQAMLGFNFGVTADINLTKNFAASFSIAANKYGGSVKYLDSIPEFEAEDVLRQDQSLSPGAVVDYKLTYIEIPIALKGKTNEIGYITYFLKAGINPSIKYKAKGDVNQNNITDVNVKNSVSLFGFGYHLGGGIEYSLAGNTRVLVEGIYTGGLSDIDNTKMIASDTGAKAKEIKITLNNVALRVGILF
ncbi:MAG: PorT family protein [Bacteroidia bacterium]|nr:PorT family protein [Bacteroidia bacterium]